MKRILLFLVVIAMVLSLASCELIKSILPSGEITNQGTPPAPKPQPKDTVTEGGLTFTLDTFKNGYILTAAIKGPEEYTVPSEIDGLPVVEVASGAFKNNLALKKVTLPDSIKTINQCIFENCTNIEELDVPFIGDKADPDFESHGTNNIGYFFNIDDPPDNLPSLDNWLKSRTNYPPKYYYVPKKLRKVTVRGGEIYDSTFRYTDIVEVHLGRGIKTIGKNAFESCEKLERITTSSQILTIENEAFRECYSLKSIKITRNTSYIGIRAFSQCVDLEWAIIPASVIKISSSAFDGCESLDKIYYMGNEESFKKLIVDSNNEEFFNASLYIYSLKKPETEGNFWHFDDNGNPIPW